MVVEQCGRLTATVYYSGVEGPWCCVAQGWWLYGLLLTRVEGVRSAVLGRCQAFMHPPLL